MNNIMYQTRMLNREIRHSNEYNKYIGSLSRLKENPELFSKTKEFMKRNFQLQCNADYNTLQDVRNLRGEFNEVLSNPLVIEFLSAEQNVSRILRKIEDEVFEGIEIAIFDDDISDDEYNV